VTGAPGSLLLLAEEMPAFVKVLARLAPDQAGALWIGILITLALAADFRRLLSGRNLALILLLAPAFPLLDIMNWGIAAERGDPASSRLLALAFAVLFPLTAVMAALGLALALRRTPGPWTFNLQGRGLRILFFLLLTLNVIVALARSGEDAGPYTSLGAQRWSETGVLPYGDPALRGTNTAEGGEARMTPGHGAAATYGPLLYVVHRPFQILLGEPRNPPGLDPMDPAYVRPSDLATRLATLLLHLLLVLALAHAGRRLAGPETALAVLCLYMASPYVLGLGSDPYLICGLAFISHVAPAAALVLAVAFLHRPLVAGASLALGAGFLFWPAFLAPPFLGLYGARGRGLGPFLAGFGGGGALILLFVLLNMPGQLDGKGPVQLFLESTVEHQEGTGPHAYGRSHFSFWHPYTGAKAWWQTPLLGGSAALKPTFLLFLGASGLALLLARRRSDAQFAGLIAALAAAIQLWKTHAGGTYVEWYLPLLLLALAAAPHPAPPDPRISDPRA
jgi:hypothetical protein